MIRARTLLIAFAFLEACGGPNGSCPPHETCSVPLITVFAASSLQPPFDRIATELKGQPGLQVSFNYAGSQTLSSQLTQGAQADVFASADAAHMATIQGAGLAAEAPKIFATNSLEIAVAPGNPKGVHALSDLSKPGLVVVLADPSVPAGNYAQQALAKAHVTVRPASFEPQVTGVLSKVALGEADAGIVYASDIKTSTRVSGVLIPLDQNVVAEYLIAPLNSAKNRSRAIAFISFVLSSEGQSILHDAGFGPA